MLSKVLSTLLFVSLLVPTDAKVTCEGNELSVTKDHHVGLLTEKACTHVYGDIVIGNLKHAKRMPSYWSVQELHGSLIIENTTGLADSVNFQNLRKILANNQSAIILRWNRGLKLAIGARLSLVNTQNMITYVFTENWPAAVTESQHYTLYRAAHVDAPVFFTDNFFMSTGCEEYAYKTWMVAFGTLSFISSFLLVGCAFYVLKSFLLIFSLIVVDVHSKRVSCTGDDLSVRSNADLLGLVDKECTNVYGDIVIANLTHVEFPISFYRNVRVVHGSIVIEGNHDVKPIIYFPRLNTVNATSHPAILLWKNTGVRFSVGDLFKRAKTQYRTLYAILENDDIISKAQYNLLHMAGFPKSTFLTDSHFNADVCLENFYKPLAGMLGFFFVTLMIALSTIALYDKPKRL